MENQYIIKGGTPLKGEVTIGGPKTQHSEYSLLQS